MTVRLRAHHLLCLLTYAGKGYSKAFISGFDLISERIGNGEDILIVDGADDICAPLMNEPDPHCLWARPVRRDRLAERDLSALLRRPVKVGERMVLNAETITAMRGAFAEGRTRSACKACPWKELCNDIADKEFNGTRLQLTQVGQL